MKLSEVPAVDVRGPLTATGARYDASQVELSGDPALTKALLWVRGIIVLAAELAGAVKSHLLPVPTGIRFGGKCGG